MCGDRCDQNQYEKEDEDTMFVLGTDEVDHDALIRILFLITSKEQVSVLRAVISFFILLLFLNYDRNIVSGILISWGYHNPLHSPRSRYLVF